MSADIAIRNDRTALVGSDSAESYAFDILGLSVLLTVDDRLFTTVAHAFMDGYATRSAMSLAGNIAAIPDLRFEVVRVRRLPPMPETTVGIHRTKHAYWNFDGCTDRARVHHVWPTRGIALDLHDSGSWSISVGPDVDPVFASESIFHAIRSVALYFRPAGNLLHGSAVACGRNVLGFVGPSMTGKTTLMTALLDAGGCAPFANDRFLVLPDDDVSVRSWPSYASFCEGQLLAIPVLANAARSYEQDACAYRTRTWSTDLAPIFDKAGKRTYPMMWLRNAYRRDYVAEGRLAAIICCRVSTEIDDLCVTVLDTRDGPARRQALDCLAESTFDIAEPSFLPWHGLAWPDDAPSHANMLERFRAAGGTVLKLEVPISGISQAAPALRDALPDLWES